MTEITEEMVEAALASWFGDDWPGMGDLARTGLQEDMRAALTAAFASMPSQGGEWVMVPRTETDEMCEAGLEALRENLGHSAVIMRDAAACYRAMVHTAAPLSASPSPYGVEELVERAFKDGLAYGSNVDGADPEIAWQHSHARLLLKKGGE